MDPELSVQKNQDHRKKKTVYKPHKDSPYEIDCNGSACRRTKVEGDLRTEL